MFEKKGRRTDMAAIHEKNCSCRLKFLGTGYRHRTSECACSCHDRQEKRANTRDRSQRREIQKGE
jgi:hypothetical protein